VLALQGEEIARMALDPTADRPLSLQLADVLRREIREGIRPPGSQLPTESEFQREYKVSRTTARTALQQLVNEGLVVTRKGYGSFVREHPPIRRVSSNRRHAAHRASGKPIFDTEVGTQGKVPSRRMLKVGLTEAPPDIAQWLQIEPGEPVVIRSRLQSVNDQPAALSSSYYPLWLAKGTRLEQPGALPEGPDNAIENLGHEFVHGVEVLKARMPTPEEGRLLRLPPGVPVVRMLHIDYDQEGRTLQVADDLYVGDWHEFVFDWVEPDHQRADS
jgi:GntR family transcriptional regulator